MATDETNPTTANNNSNNVPPIYDLIYNPTTLTIRSSIPNIPDLAAPTASDISMQHWPRIECINIHHQLMSTYIDTRARSREIERTSKTSRGWWIVWVRMASDPATDTNHEDNDNNSREEKSEEDPSAPAPTQTPQEAFLVRKSTDSYASSTTASNSNSPGKIHARGQSTGSAAVSFFRDLGGAPMASSISGGQSSAGTEMDTGPSRLVEGLGIDARRYLERLMGLN